MHAHILISWCVITTVVMSFPLLDDKNGVKHDSALLDDVKTELTTDEDKKSFDEFRKFMKEFDRSYADVSEAKKRFGVFKESVKRAAAQQSADSGATYGVTKFSDYTPEEFRDFLRGSE